MAAMGPDFGLRPQPASPPRRSRLLHRLEGALARGNEGNRLYGTGKTTSARMLLHGVRRDEE